MKDKQLYERIFAFDIDGGPAELTFEMRLARENGWTEGFARRVIVEYKRFVYLSMVSGHACSPSDAVDEAWHLHLTYTRIVLELQLLSAESFRRPCITTQPRAVQLRTQSMRIYSSERWIVTGHGIRRAMHRWTSGSPRNRA